MIGIKNLVRFAVLAAGVTLGSQAFAADITLQMPLCSNFTLSGNPPNQVLVCNTGSVPSCVVAPQPAAAAIGATVTLTATCTNTPTLWTWTGCTTSTGNSCSVTSAAAATINGKVSATNGQGAGPDTAWAVTFNAGAPQAPSGCTIALTTPASLPNAGGAVGIDVNCSGVSATTWTLKRDGNVLGTKTTNQASFSDTLPAGGATSQTYTYTAVPDNGGTPGSTTPTNVKVTVAGSGGGGASCVGFSVQDLGPLSFNNVPVVFDLGPGDKTMAITSYTATAADAGLRYGISLAEYVGANSHYMTIYASKTRCDLTTTLRVSNSGPWLYPAGTGVTPAGSPGFTMAPGETWYFMIRNWKERTATSSCDLCSIILSPGRLN
jgi:hypothetical protein